jgi:hypothetical protein
MLLALIPSPNNRQFLGVFLENVQKCIVRLKKSCVEKPEEWKAASFADEFSAPMKASEAPSLLGPPSHDVPSSQIQKLADDWLTVKVAAEDDSTLM